MKTKNQQIQKKQPTNPVKQSGSPKTATPAAGIQKETYLMVPPHTIHADETLNPRIEYGDIEELMHSILENGIRNPLKAYEKDGQFILKDGHRRMRAVKLALSKGKQIERVPLILEKQAQNQEERTLEYILYNDGKPFTMLEQSEVIRRLINFGWQITDIVKRTGKARGYIENLILLNKTPMKTRNQIKEGKISSHAVIQIMQAVKGDPEKAAREVEIAIQKATEAGKDKATPKHVTTPEVKIQSFGKFYKWAEEIADTLAGRKDTKKEKVEVLEKLLMYFENGKTPEKTAEEYFTDKIAKPAPSAKNTPAQKKK